MNAITVKITKHNYNPIPTADQQWMGGRLDIEVIADGAHFVTGGSVRMGDDYDMYDLDVRLDASADVLDDEVKEAVEQAIEEHWRDFATYNGHLFERSPVVQS